MVNVRSWGECLLRVNEISKTAVKTKGQMTLIIEKKKKPPPK